MQQMKKYFHWVDQFEISTVKKSKNVSIVNMLFLEQAIWRDIWQYTAEESHMMWRV